MFCPDKNLKWPHISYANMTLCSLALAIWVCYGCPGFWRDQTSDLKEPFGGRMYLWSRGQGGLLGGLAPQGVCSWEGLLFREHPEPPLPSSGKVCCIHGQRELGKPQRKAICSCWGKYCKMGGKKKAWVIVSTVKAVIQNPNWGKRWLINNVPGFFSPRESLNCATTFIAELTWSIV